MWMVPTEIMCRQHLLGEHLELHMFVGSINRGCDMSGYVRNNLLEVESLHSRHRELVEEMDKRYYNHQSPLGEVTRRMRKSEVGEIDREKSLEDLLFRCPRCLSMWEVKG